MKKKRYPFFRAGMTVLLFLFLIASSVSLLLWNSVPLYALAVRLLGIGGQAGVSEAVCVKNYRALARYLFVFGPAELSLPDFAVSRTGAVHFREVKEILCLLQILSAAGFPVLWYGLREGRKNHCLEWLRDASVLMIALLAVLLSGILTDRTGTFVLLHRILFTNSYWQFDPEKDPVIRILTEEVFLLAAVFLMMLLSGELVFCLHLYRKGSRRKINGKNMVSHGKKRHGEGYR